MGPPPWLPTPNLQSCREEGGVEMFSFCILNSSHREMHLCTSHKSFPLSFICLQIPQLLSPLICQGVGKGSPAPVSCADTALSEFCGLQLRIGAELVAARAADLGHDLRTSVTVLLREDTEHFQAGIPISKASPSVCSLEPAVESEKDEGTHIRTVTERKTCHHRPPRPSTPQTRITDDTIRLAGTISL